MSLGSVVILYSLYLVSVSGQKLDQDISWTRKKGEVVSFSCKDYDRCKTFLLWFQKKEGETFTYILAIFKDDCTIFDNIEFPQKDDFSAMRKKNNCDLKIQSVKVSHSATYYCACRVSGTHIKHHLPLFSDFINEFTTTWPNPHASKLMLHGRAPFMELEGMEGAGLRVFTVYAYEFGSGTRLYVTDNHVRKPKVTVYPASNPESNGKTTLICLARDMFPDLVKISWKMEDEYGQTVEVSKAETEQLEQREEGQTTSMIIIDKENAYKNKYRCYVEHEGDPQDVDMLKDPFSFMCSLNLASLVYTVMIVKSMVYCCGLSLLLHHRNMGKWTQHL
ncbi:uncharacterized protein [Salmo salar]|uniref:Ig-like domain-containing protein n=1 Tax=Salmo salar TaxID=8030 RepID=A0ABM3DMY6_SALSA|nr:uncharacterized protein LOC106580237 [Salmo salar]